MAKKKKRERERQVWTLVVVWDTIGMLIIWNLFKDIYRLPWRLSSKESVYMQEPQEKWVPSLGWEDPLEEEMTTHSSILAWRIPWTEEPSRLQSMGSQRIGHN